VVIFLLLAAAALIWPVRLRPGWISTLRESAAAVRSDAGGAAVGRPVVGAGAVAGAVWARPSATPAVGGATTTRSRLPRLLAGAGAVCALAAAGAVAGIAGLVATTAVLATGGLLVRRALADRRGRAASTEILAALRMLGRELRAGAEPATAAANASAACRGQGAEVLLELAHLARSDGALSRRVGGHQNSVRAQTVEQLRCGWLLTRRHGLAFTPLVDALAATVAEQLAADAERSGQVAGPRMSGYVMAVLPVLGLGLGIGMGADPLRVLMTTPVGRVLLVVGVGLTCAGLLWSARIVRQ